MTTHVMLDLETMSTGSYASVLSIGACKFDPHGVGLTGGTFYMPVNLSSSMKAGLRVDADTVEWWLDAKQTAARDRWLAEDKVDLESALFAFEAWYLQGTMLPEMLSPIWGNGAVFDNVILSNAYKALGLDVPWTHRQDRCFRTMRNFIRPQVEPDADCGVKHHALDDAIAQAKHLQKIVLLRHLTVE